MSLANVSNPGVSIKFRNNNIIALQLGYCGWVHHYGIRQAYFWSDQYVVSNMVSMWLVCVGMYKVVGGVVRLGGQNAMTINCSRREPSKVDVIASALNIWIV